MKILQVHNFYQKAGGEDTVFRVEKELLLQKGHTVDELLFDNKEINEGALSKITTGLGSLYSFKSYRLIKDKIREFNPDVIHVHNFFPLASPSIFYAASHAQVPIVMTLHNFRLICPTGLLFHDNEIYEKSVHKIIPWDAIRKGVYRNSKIQTAAVAFTTGLHKFLGTWKGHVDRFICLTDFAKQKFMDSSLGLKEEKIAVKPNFMDDLGVGSENREDYLINIGRLSPEKGTSVLLELAQKSKYRIKVIGDGPLRPEVEKVQAEHPHLEYLGYRDKAFITEQLQNARGLVFPSLCYEGMPMTILEAFSTATPVVASQLGGPSTMIENGVNGLFFPPGDVTTLIQQLDKLYTDQDLHKSIQKEARKSYETYYTQDMNYEMLKKIYEEVIEEKKGVKVN